MVGRPTDRAPSHVARVAVATVLLANSLSGCGGGSDGSSDDGQRGTSSTTPSAGLPLGPDGVEETRDEREIVPGVRHLTIERGHGSEDDFWTVTIAVTNDEQTLRDVESTLADLGHTPRRDVAAGPDPRRPEDGPLATVLRVGRYPDRGEADRVRGELAEAGVSGRVDFTGEDGLATTGPWSLDVVVIDPEVFEGEVTPELAHERVQGTETVSAMAARTGAVVAVNGGFFVVRDARSEPGPWLAGVAGDVAGLSVLDGELISEAVHGRPALVLPETSGADASVRRLTSRSVVRASATGEREVTGINRQAGLVVNCGGSGDPVTTRAVHDYTCANPDELIAITTAFGRSAPDGPGYQMTLDTTGRALSAMEERGGPLPSGATVLQGTGTGAEWLRDRVESGEELTLHHAVEDAITGRPLPLTAETQIISGGPLLVTDGEIALDPVMDGWSPEPVEEDDRVPFYNDWYLRRNPRTAAGLTADGRIILVTADGRNPDHSLGLSIVELAAVMQGLGAVDALNLDGGGSTMMVVESEAQVRPSDRDGERPVGEALLVIPRSDS